MVIEGSLHLLQHIDNGGLVSLDNHGQLQEQSGFAKFFQDIGDAFLNLSASGRAMIDERNTRLGNAMHAMVAEDNPLPNLAQEALPQGGRVLSPEGRILLERMEIGKQVAKLPPEGRHLAQATLYRLNADYRQSHPDASLKDVLQFIKQEGKHMASTPTFVKTLCNLQKVPTQEQMAPFIQAIKQEMSNVFSSSDQQEKIDKDTGIHSTYLGDIVRSTVLSVNGEPVRARGEGEKCSVQELKNIGSAQLQKAIPKEFRGIASFMASQAGCEGGLCMQLGMNGANWGIPTNAELVQAHLQTSYPHHNYTINVTETAINVGFVIDVNLSLTATSDGEDLEPAFSLATARYQGNVSIPLNQNPQPGQVPEFDVTMTMQPQ